MGLFSFSSASKFAFVSLFLPYRDDSEIQGKEISCTHELHGKIDILQYNSLHFIPAVLFLAFLLHLYFSLFSLDFFSQVPILH